MTDSYRAALCVNSVDNFVMAQGESMLKEVVAQYPYEADPGTNAPSLRENSDDVTDMLTRRLQVRRFIFVLFLFFCGESLYTQCIPTQFKSARPGPGLDASPHPASLRVERQQTRRALARDSARDAICETTAAWSTPVLLSPPSPTRLPVTCYIPALCPL